MPDEQPYSRLYHKLADEYPGLYDSPDLAGYCRLLVAADQAWPQSARWSGYVTKSQLTRIAATGLVLVDGPRYRIKGMDKQRQARSEAARFAINKRWDTARTTNRTTTGSTDRNTEAIPKRDETSKDETSKEKARVRAPVERPEKRENDRAGLQKVGEILRDKGLM